MNLQYRLIKRPCWGNVQYCFIKKTINFMLNLEYKIKLKQHIDCDFYEFLMLKSIFFYIYKQVNR